MKIINSLKCVSILINVSFSIGLLLICSSVANSASLPVFSDPNMQACFEEMTALNNWVEAEDVDILNCSNRNIQFLDSLETLVNLVELDISDNSFNEFGSLPNLGSQAPSLERLNLSGSSLSSLQPIIGLENLTHLFLNDVQVSGIGSNFTESSVFFTLTNNTNITHLGLNGIASLGGIDLSGLPRESDVLNALPLNLVSLELSSTNLTFLPSRLELLTQLEVLDLSDNPLDTGFALTSFLQQSPSLKQLNLSDARLLDLSSFFTLENLTHLILNDVTFGDEFFNNPFNEQDLFEILRINPDITHLSLNNIGSLSESALFDELPLNLISLELSGTDLKFLPFRFNQLTKIETLDLSNNPLDPTFTFLPFFQQAQSLKKLNLSGTTLFSLLGLFELEDLTHLTLNDVSFGDEFSSIPFIEQDLFEILRNNSRITHLGLNSIGALNELDFFNYLPFDLVSLEVSNTGLNFLPPQFEQFTQLEVLDLSDNPLNTEFVLSPFFQQAQSLEQLNLSGNKLFGLFGLFELRNLTHLILNDVTFGDEFSNTPFIEQNLSEIFRNNTGITHLSLNNIGSLSDSLSLLNFEDLKSLELSNTNLTSTFPLFDFIGSLEVLDLSNNPLNFDFVLVALSRQTLSLKQLNLSGNQLFNSSVLALMQLKKLTHLILNDVTFNDGFSNTPFFEQEIYQTLRNNPEITHLGLNSIGSLNEFELFDALSLNLMSLEVSDTDLAFLPPRLDQMTQLEVLDLSDNPLDTGSIFSSFFQQAESLEQLNLSGTNLFNLLGLFELNNLTHLFLNDVTFGDEFSNTTFFEQDLFEILRNNSKITHLGLNSIGSLNEFELFAELSSNIISLELSNTGLEFLPPQFEQLSELKKLDLSNNPLSPEFVFSPFFQQVQALEQLNLNNTKLFNLFGLFELENLTHLLLNDVTFGDDIPDPLFFEQDLLTILRNNSGITHLGLNNFDLLNEFELFSELSANLVSLEVSNAGLEFLPPQFEQLTQLKILDLSNNPLNEQLSFSSFSQQVESLEQLNLSGTSLLDLSAVAALRNLTHLILNNVTLVDESDSATSVLIQNLTFILFNNRRITHLGLNSIASLNESNLFNELPINLVSLELSNTGLEFLPFQLEQLNQLEILDLSNNPLSPEFIFSPFFKQTLGLEQLNLSGTNLANLSGLFELENLTHLTLNDVNFNDVFSGPLFLEENLFTILRNNSGITHLSLNNFGLLNEFELFNELSLNLELLELSNIGLEFLPLQFEQLTRLETLDLSNNPIESLGNLENLKNTLSRLNLSNTNLNNLFELFALRALTHLNLNGAVIQNFSVSDVNEILLNNLFLIELGLSGLPIGDEIAIILDTLSNSNVVRLEIANTGISDIALPSSLAKKLEYLDLSFNNLTTIPNLDLAQSLVVLLLNNNSIVDIGSLLVDLPQLRTLGLLGNNLISCESLETLEVNFSNNIDITPPESCDNGETMPPKLINTEALAAIILYILAND